MYPPHCNRCEYAPEEVKCCDECPKRDRCSVYEAMMDYWESAMGDDL